MELLKVGSKGDLVFQWETFLRGQGFLLDKEVDTSYTDATSRATALFQKKYGLGNDGVAGNETIGYAMSKFGFEIVSTDQDIPLKPPGVTQLGSVQRAKLFGEILYVPDGTPTNPERIRITNDWDKTNIGYVEIPQLKNVKGAGSKIAFHKKGIPQLTKFFDRIEKEGLLPRILTWGGTWSPRFIRGSRTTLSNHSWATAFDCNMAWNGLGCRPALIGREGSVREIVEIGYECGFFWGGHFSGRKDGMHFELFKIL